MQQKILLPIAFIISFLLLSVAVFMVIKSRSETTQIRTNMTENNPETVQTPHDSGSPFKPTIPVPTMTNEIRLTISTPKNGATIQVNTVVIQGITEPKAEVFVNDVSTIADSTGEFSANVALDEGDNQIVIVAHDEFGNTAEAELTVAFEAKPE